MPVNPIRTGIHLDKRKKRRKGIQGALFLFLIKKKQKRKTISFECWEDRKISCSFAVLENTPITL